MAPEGNAPRSDPPSTRATILMLDDSAQDREILRRMLVSDPFRDYVIHEYTGIEEALAACPEIQPDCILLDYSLGDGTGLDFLAALRDLGGTRVFPVVMLTGSGSEEVAARAFRAGVLDYLPKGSISADVIQRAISGAIYKAKTERLLEQQRLELQRLFLQAQEANARKDQFLAALSHELRTPLMPILTAVTSIDTKTLTPGEAAEVFSTIRRNVELEARLIDDLLDLTRITKGKLRLDFQPVDAHEVLRHALETCREDLSHKDLQVTIGLAADSHTVSADPARLQQVFWNLLKNAVKFTPAGGKIHISTRNSNSGHFEAEVTDSGVGITAEALPRIFNAFEQGSADMTRRFGGLGLGLAISHALAESHRGSLRALSAGRDQGASFILALPVAAEELPRPQPQPAGAQPEGVRAGDANPGQYRILLVEDHVDTARLLARSLRRLGYQVIVAGSVSEAIAAFNRETVDAVVSDIGLPDGDGIEVLERLRKIREVPGVALSGYGMEHDLARSRAAGFTDHLIKPVDWRILEATLRQILRDQPDCGAAGGR